MSYVDPVQMARIEALNLPEARVDAPTALSPNWLVSWMIGEDCRKWKAGSTLESAVDSLVKEIEEQGRYWQDYPAPDTETKGE